MSAKARPKLGPRAAAFTDLLIEVFRVNRLLLDAGDEMTRPEGLSSSRWQVLGIVEHRPTSVATAAREIGLTRQAVQYTADAMEREGMIAWAPNPHHRRAKLMTITPKGREALDRVQRRQREWAAGVASAQRLDDLQRAVETLRKLRTTLDSTPLETDWRDPKWTEGRRGS